MTVLGTEYDAAVAIPTLVGSFLSCLASGFIFLCYIILPQSPHFRHILILNLAGAGTSALKGLSNFFNSLNNTISGTYLFVHGYIKPSPLCTVNGFAGQLTVQGTDFSILLIAVATVFALNGSENMPAVSRRNKAWASLSIWIVPLITSFTALGFNDYAPVSGNWCWLSRQRPVLRYALNHGWRFSIILITMILYIYLWIYFRRQFREIRELRSSMGPDMLTPITEEDEEDFRIADNQRHTWRASQRAPNALTEERDVERLEKTEPTTSIGTSNPWRASLATLGSTPKQPDMTIPLSSSKTLTDITSFSLSLSPVPTTSQTQPAYNRNPSLSKKQREIRKVLLLNAYPIAYVILWTPGIANRITELSGHSSRALNILQSSTQFIGLANAITYGYNENIRRQVKRWSRRGKEGGRRYESGKV